jgi:segregation and condensation protein A
MSDHPEQFTFDFRESTAQILSNSEDLQVKIGDFAGPLDLLLFLIRQEQANIFDIPIARITEKYLEFIRMMKRLDIAVAADFLVMAATLIEVKSKMLLPRDPFIADEDEIEDPRKDLVDRLLEYEKFKTAAGMLYERSTIEQAIFTRGLTDTDDAVAEVDATVFDLLTVFQKIVARHKEDIKLEIQREEISLAEMLRTLKSRLTAERSIDVIAFFEGMGSKRELVTAFIAVLEIVRTEGVRLVQKSTFGGILLRMS